MLMQFYYHNFNWIPLYYQPVRDDHPNGVERGGVCVYIKISFAC